MSMMLGITVIIEPYPTVYAGKDSIPKKRYVKKMVENGKMVLVTSKRMMKIRQTNSVMNLIR